MSCTHCGKGRATPSGALAAAKIQTPETTEVRSWTSLPLLDVTDIPEDLDLIGGSNKQYQSWRVPASIFLGGAVNSSKYTVHQYTPIETSQVKPVRFSSSAFGIIPAKASAGETAQALAIVSDEDKETTTLMISGFWNNLAGLLFGVAKVVIVFSVLLMFIEKVDTKQVILKPEFKTESFTYKYVQPVAPFLTNWITEKRGQLSGDSGQENCTNP